MSLGDRNYKQGGQGSQHGFEHRNLLALGELAGVLGGIIPPGGLATEATLLQILNNIIASQDVEILLVRDTGNSDQVVQQIREYDQGTGAWTTRYEDVDGNAYVPVGPLEYLDPSAVLSLVLAELITLNTTDFSTETTLAQLLTDFNAEDFASQTTLAALLTAFNAEDFASETTLASLDSNVVLGNITLNNLLTAFNAEDFAQEATLAALAATDFATETTLGGIATDITTLTGLDYATETTLAAVNADTTSIDASLTALNAKFNTLGQKLSAASHPVVLSTEQEQILSDIETAISALDTSSLATEATLLATNVLLTAIDTVLDNIKLDTANLDVALSTLATEVTLGAIETLLTSIDGKDFATETTLSSVDAQFTGSNPITRVDISGNGAYVIPAATYTSIQLIVTAGTVSDGTITYPEGVFNENAKLNKTLGTVTFNATGATAFVKLMA